MNNTHGIASFVSYIVLTQAQRGKNCIMVKLRVSVEWCFGMMNSTCPYITKSNILKLKQGYVSMLISVALLLADIKSMVDSNKISKYFDCERMPMRKYLHFNYISLT